MDFLSTLEGSYAGQFYPQGWDFRRIKEITSLGPEQFAVPQPYWSPNFLPEICADVSGGFETMSGKMGFEIFHCVAEAAQKKQPLVFILPVGPMGMYAWAVYFSLRTATAWGHVHTFSMDEWSDAHGNTPLRGSGASFQEEMEKALFGQLGELSVPPHQRHFATREELPLYPELIAGLRSAGARLVVVYGIGRSCHIAFWEPHFALEFSDEKEWKSQTHRIAAQLHPLSIEQNSLHSFASRVTLVPLRANTIGPGLFLAADYAIGGADGAHGSLNWQGQPIWMTLRYGPDPWVPSSFMPTIPGRLFVTEQLAGPLRPAAH
jgi:glucosamine-6-phosphate deaminase